MTDIEKEKEFTKRILLACIGIFLVVCSLSIPIAIYNITKIQGHERFMTHCLTEVLNNNKDTGICSALENQK